MSKILAASLLVALVLIAAINIINKKTEPKAAVLPQANLPVLKIDGKKSSEVYLQSLDIQVEVIGSIASTRYTMVFKNRTNRTLEGELTFPLPDGRSVTHYALDINGKMREAVPVEKARGTVVFEEIERRQVDPGLLERVEGNNFRTRIYPIPANGGTRTISIGYEEELALEKGVLRYSLPTAYPDSLEKFSAKATVWQNGKKEIHFDKNGVFTLPVQADIPQVVMQPAARSFYFLASVAPKIENRKKQWSSDLAIIWDVSLSASERNLQKEIEMLNILFAENKNANINLYFLNNKLKKIASGNWNELKPVLEKTIFDGGTDFSQINLNDIAGNEILFFSDGISTLSDADFLENANENRSVHCIVSSAKADYSAMKLIASKTKGKFVNFNALPFEKVKNELLNETLQFLGTEHGEAVREIYPSIVSPVNGNFSLAGISDTSDAEFTLLFGFGNEIEKRIKVKLDSKDADNNGNIYKIWAQKKIAELDLDYENNYAELTELGQQFGIATRNTSLIVLETTSDYVRYGIEQPASMGQPNAPQSRGVLKNFSAYNLMKEEKFAKDIDKVLKNVAGLQTSGKTELGARRGSASGGFNDGYAEGGIGDMLGGSLAGSSPGSIGSSRKVPVARDIDTGSGDGSRSKKEIMEVVNVRMPGLRRIYNQYTKSNFGLSGKVTLKFTIAASGDIISISIVSSTTGNPKFDEAIKGTVATWKWKSIKSGNTTPTIPFNFSDGDDIQDKAMAAAEDIRKWWNTNFIMPEKYPASQKYKYPMPDKKEEDSFAKGNDYLDKLTGNAEDDYKIYLKLRDDYANSPAFYFDMADWFYRLGEKETALCILTSIAELELENASLYRMLGYKFKEYGEYALGKFVCQKVVQWRPMEPQSYRDYALALADNGEEQEALDSLYSLLTKLYSENIGRRSLGIEEVVVMEINNLIAKNQNLDASKIDKRMIMSIPVDIRVVLNWNVNDSNIDLHVLDPNGEECSFRNTRTNIGGRISKDNTSGLGPEQFILKKAMNGKYKVYANYYGAREFAQAGPATIMVEIYAKNAQRRVVSLQLSKPDKTSSGKVEVASFEI